MRFPASIIFSLIAITLILAFSSLGYWQLEKGEAKDERIKAFDSASAFDQLPGISDALEFSRVTISGQFLATKRHACR